MDIVQSESALTGFAAVALMTLSTKSFTSNGILIATIAVRNGDVITMQSRREVYNQATTLFLLFKPHPAGPLVRLVRQ